MENKDKNRSKYNVSSKWYDMDENLQNALEEKPKRRFSVSELAKSINQIFANSAYISYDENAKFDARNYLKKNGSDIITRLQEKLGFDAELHKDDSTEIKFEKLKILKQICIAEKFGVKKDMSKCYFEEYEYHAGELPKYKLPLIDIIAEPSLSYVGSNYSEYSLYKPEFERVLNIIRKHVEKPENIENEINEIHGQWRTLVMSTHYDACISFSDYNSEDEYIKKEDSIKKTFDNLHSIPINVCEHIEKMKELTKGPIEKFYTILLTTKIRSELRDYNILRRFSFDRNKTEENSEKKECLNKYFRNDAPSKNIKNMFNFNSFYNKLVTFHEFNNYIKRGKRTLKDFDINQEKKAVWSLILLKEDPQIKDITELYDSAYEFALKYSQRIADIWHKYQTTKGKKSTIFVFPSHVNNPDESTDKNLGNKYEISIWCIVFRELLYISLKYESIDNKFKYYRNSKRTLTATVKSNSDFEGLAKMILIKHLQDRITLMYQSEEVVSYNQKIEKHILDIEEKVMLFHTIDEIREADKIIRFVVSLSSESEEFIEMKYKYLTYNLWYETIKKGMYTQRAYNIEFINDKIKHDFLSALSRDTSYRGVQNMKLYYFDEIIFKKAIAIAESDDKIKALQELVKMLYTRARIPKNKTASDCVNNIFYLCINNCITYNEIQTYSSQINISFQKTTDYNFYFTFDIDRNKKIITIKDCTFEDKIQNILNLRERP